MRERKRSTSIRAHSHTCARTAAMPSERRNGTTAQMNGVQKRICLYACAFLRIVLLNVQRFSVFSPSVFGQMRGAHKQKEMLLRIKFYLGSRAEEFVQRICVLTNARRFEWKMFLETFERAGERAKEWETVAANYTTWWDRAYCIRGRLRWWVSAL